MSKRKPDPDANADPDSSSSSGSGKNKAFTNRQFLASPPARPLRILAEYLEPQERFAHYHIEDTIIFFGSARILSRAEAEANLQVARDEEAAAGDPDGGGVAAAELAFEMSRYYEATRELAHRLTTWSKGLDESERRFVVCSGGGPGIMEAANLGASEAKGLNIGLNITVPFEARDNVHVTRELNFDFHYFFMRKFWFAYLAKAVVVMPGGFGTLDEFFELLTLVQTKKITKRMPIVLFGKQYWSEVIDFDALKRYGTIGPHDEKLFFRTDSVDDAFDHITQQLSESALATPGPSL